jgi:hypothetical protein
MLEGKQDPRLLRGVIADVRAAIPGMTREKMAEAIRHHFEDATLIENELDRSYGCQTGAYG